MIWGLIILMLDNKFEGSSMWMTFSASVGFPELSVIPCYEWCPEVYLSYEHVYWCCYCLDLV